MHCTVITDRKTYSGTPVQCLAAMSEDRWYTGRRSVDWMRDVSTKALTEHGATIRVDTARDFLEDLHQAGLLRLEMR